MLVKELEAYQKKHNMRNKIAGQDQRDLILRYVLIKCDVGDLFCQRTVIEEFLLDYIKRN